MRRLLRFALPISLLAVLGVQAPAHATPHAFLKISGIPGESTEAVAPNQIALVSWDWGARRLGGRAREPASPLSDDFEFETNIDAESPLLSRAVALGTPIPSAKLSVFRAATTPPTLSLEYCFEDVVVRSVGDNGTAEGGGGEKVAMVASKVEERYTPQSSSG